MDQEYVKKTEETEPDTSNISRPTIRHTKMRRFFFPAIVLASVLVLALSISVFAVISISSRDINVEVNAVADFSHIEKSPIISLFCEIKEDTDKIDTSSIKSYTIPTKLFFFFDSFITVNVIDTTPPEFSLYKLNISQGLSLTPESFVMEGFDFESNTLTFDVSEKMLNTFGTHKVKISATDKQGNTATKETVLTVVDTSNELLFDYDSTLSTVLEKVNLILPNVDNLDVSEFKENSSFIIKGKKENNLYVYAVHIKDVTPPEATVSSHDILLGQTLLEDDIVFDIFDDTDVTVEFNPKIDYSKVGEQVIEIKLTDTYGNITIYTSVIRIHNINTVIPATFNTTLSTIKSSIFKDSFSQNTLTINKSFDISQLQQGVNRLTLHGKFNNISVQICIDDNKSPTLRLKNITRPLGVLLSPAEFVSYSYDVTPISYSFTYLVSTAKTGTFPITIKATDTDGNYSVSTAYLTVIDDKTPPVISGIKSYTIYENGYFPNFLQGVSATDNIPENIKLKYDASNVNRSKAGIYTVKYIATDQAGNVSEAIGYITVLSKPTARLSVNNILQKPQLPNGCEAVSLAIVLNYYGYTIDPLSLYRGYMPKASFASGDPWVSYVGNAEGDGIGCFAPCVVTTGNKFLSEKNSDKKVYDVSNMPVSTYEHYVDQGIPVILWGYIDMNVSDYVAWYYLHQGKYQPWYSFSHCLVLIGYTENTYIFCDPMRGIVEHSKAKVERSFQKNYSQACIVK